MRQQLSRVDRMQRVFALQLHCNPSLHNQIRAESALQLDRFIDERHRFLPLNTQPNLLNLTSQASLISRLQQSRPQLAVNLDRRPNNLFRKLSGIHEPSSEALLSVLRGSSQRPLRLKTFPLSAE